MGIVEERIIEKSLQHPDFGFKRLLPLLRDIDIDVSASTVYRILKRHGLQTRVLRQSKIKEQRLAELPPGAMVPSPALVEPMALQVDVPKPVAGETAERKIPPRSLSAANVPAKASGWKRTFFYIINSLLLALIGYLGIGSVRNFQQTDLEPATLIPISPPPGIVVAETESTLKPVNDYRAILTRDLFCSHEALSRLESRSHNPKPIFVHRSISFF